MFEFLTDFFRSITLQGALVGFLIFVLTLGISLAIVSVVLVKLPATYFKESHERDFLGARSPAIRWVAIVGKNLLGVVLVLLGIVLSIPGVPGQGLLTILLGIMLLDFPGKRRLESRLVSRPTIFNAINKLRHRFGKPALEVD
ncbi:MAG: hypothetical protein ACREBG_00025 [Pyrinomonadaceae bacterium]